MKDLKKLRQARSEMAKRGKAALDELNSLLAKSAPTEVETARIAMFEGEVDDLEKKVEATDVEIASEERKARRSTLFGQAARSMDVNPETTNGFKTLAEFAVAVRSHFGQAGTDPRLLAAPTNFHENGGSAGEGFMVPAEYRQQIWEIVYEPGELLARVSPEPTSSNSVKITKDETTPWGATGVQAYWRSEGNQMTASKHAAQSITVDLHELYAFVLATEELLSDAPRLQSRLTVKAAQAIRYKASESIMTGDGVGKPLGFMNHAAKVAVAKESGQAADTIVTANVLKQFSRLLKGNLRNAFWMANDDTLPQLGVLAIGNQPIWTPPNAGLSDAPGGMLLGRPILFAEHATTVGDEGDLTLIDPSGYYAANKTGGGIDFASSIHLYFDYNMSAFRWIFRLGGQPIMSAPVSPAKGSNTKSHFVTIAERA